jgi:hypothetical protein
LARVSAQSVNIRLGFKIHPVHRDGDEKVVMYPISVINEPKKVTEWLVGI